MSMPLLTTKLYMPPLRPNLVPRPHLAQRINAGIKAGHRLTLISAPAGFGKTTLLNEWAYHPETQRHTPRVAWLSLDKSDDDPIRFWSYVLLALQTTYDALKTTALPSLTPESGDIESVIAQLINNVDGQKGPFVLVLDDFHRIETPSIHAALDFLLAHIPPQMHLIIASRVDPPLAISRLRGKGQLNELRARDLRFSAKEIATFFNQTMDLNVSKENVAALEARTEGWIAGLQLAAISMRGQEEEYIDSFVAAFTGSHRYVLDYLTEEILQRQPEAVQTFLHQTAVLDRLSGPLCDAVTGQPDSQRVLEDLDRSNLFIVPLDNERRWYRYHHLFSELLRSRLQQLHAEHVPELHRKASLWYAQNGLINEALEHALRANDVDRAVLLVEQNALTLLDHGELINLVGWLDALPKEAVAGRPWFCIARAWATAYAGQLDHVEPILAGTGHAADCGQALIADPAEREHVAGHVAAIRAYVAWIRGESESAIAFSNQALERLPETDCLARGIAKMTFGIANQQIGRLTESVTALTEAVAISQIAGQTHVAALAVSALGYTFMLQGRLHQAAQVCRDALQRAETAEHHQWYLPATANIHTTLGEILYEWNDLENGLRHTQYGNDLSKRWRQADSLAYTQINLAKWLMVTDDAAGAFAVIQEARKAAVAVSGWFTDIVNGYELELYLMQRNVVKAMQWLRQSGMSPDDDIAFGKLGAYTQMAEVFILAAAENLNGNLEVAHRLLARLLSISESMGIGSHVVRVLALQALAWQIDGQTALALQALERALTLAEPEGYVRTFVECGAPMQQLLYQATAKGIATTYVRGLLDAFDQVPPGLKKAASSVQPGQSVPQDLVEPLSEREIEVLRLLSAGLSNKEIAQTLYIAVGTVKNHLRNVYGKLAVSSRTQAIAKAQEMQLI
ncbi:MAG: helix-turn-helix transcriptional regulator [Anaerolineae bacterium]|nr:helix-turn-helix transcriptional regulator [Anaerolineae bacterium]